MNEKFLENKKEYTETELNKMILDLRMKLHPDKGGDSDIWYEFNDALEKAKGGNTEELIKLHEKIILKDGDEYSEYGKMKKDSEQIGKNINIKT
jgi:hypothetical protein